MVRSALTVRTLTWSPRSARVGARSSSGFPQIDTVSLQELQSESQSRSRWVAETRRFRLSMLKRKRKEVKTRWNGGGKRTLRCVRFRLDLSRDFRDSSDISIHGCNQSNIPYCPALGEPVCPNKSSRPSVAPPRLLILTG